MRVVRTTPPAILRASVLQRRTRRSINVSIPLQLMLLQCLMYFYIFLYYRYIFGCSCWFGTASQAIILNDKVLFPLALLGRSRSDSVSLICVSITSWNGPCCTPERKPVQRWAPARPPARLRAGSGGGSAPCCFEWEVRPIKNTIILRSFAETHLMHAEYG